MPERAHAKKLPGEPERRVRELELEAALQMLDGIRDGLILQDASGRIRKINKAMERIVGVSDAQARGKTVQEVMGEGNLCFFFGKAGRFENTFWIGGREFQIECESVLDSNGTRIGQLTSFHDATEIREADQAKADFISMVTHDLKSPLTTILGYSALLLEGGQGDLTPQMLESMKAIERSGMKLLSTIDDFLILSRLDAGAEAKKEAVDVTKLAEPIVAALWQEAARSGKVLELAVEPGLPEITGDRRQLERVLGHLLDNALKFTRPGGRITASVALAAGERIEEKAGKTPPNLGPHIEIVVSDDGVGIPKEDLPHIFDRYWRGRLSGEHHGCGLGLAIVKCGVEAHGGLVKAESEGIGSTFYVWLPIERK